MTSTPLSTAAADLAALFLAPRSGEGVPLVFGGIVTTWDPVSKENEVSLGGGVFWTNLKVLHPSLLTTGVVLLVNSSAGPVILGNLDGYTEPDPDQE